jgi:Golgi phosphoprotein 3 (GPP34)
MTTPRDLLMVAMDMEPGRPPEQGDLSLALAGAELIDLLGVQAIRLDGERIVPVHQPDRYPGAPPELGRRHGAAVRGGPDRRPFLLGRLQDSPWRW